MTSSIIFQVNSKPASQPATQAGYYDSSLFFKSHFAGENTSITLIFTPLFFYCDEAGATTDSFLLLEKKKDETHARRAHCTTHFTWPR